MKVTLRRAAQLSTEVYKLISTKTVEVQNATSVKVKPVRSNHIGNIREEKLDHLFEVWEELKQLYSAYADLRTQIGIGNAKEVTPLLSQISVIDMEIKAQTQLLNSITPNTDSVEVTHDDFERACQVYANPTSTESYYGRTDSEYRLNVVDEVFKGRVEDTLVLLRKMKTNLTDQVLAANVITEIELNDFTQEVLEKFRII